VGFCIQCQPIRIISAHAVDAMIGIDGDLVYYAHLDVELWGKGDAAG